MVSKWKFADFLFHLTFVYSNNYLSIFLPIPLILFLFFLFFFDLSHSSIINFFQFISLFLFTYVYNFLRFSFPFFFSITIAFKIDAAKTIRAAWIDRYCTTSIPRNVCTRTHTARANFANAIFSEEGKKQRFSKRFTRRWTWTNRASFHRTQ